MSPLYLEGGINRERSKPISEGREGLGPFLHFWRPCRFGHHRLLHHPHHHHRIRLRGLRGTEMKEVRQIVLLFILFFLLAVVLAFLPWTGASCERFHLAGQGEENGPEVKLWLFLFGISQHTFEELSGFSRSRLFAGSFPKSR